MFSQLIMSNSLLSFDLALAQSQTGFPALWLFEGSNKMQYNGPKDLKSLEFFINEILEVGSENKKVTKRMLGATVHCRILVLVFCN